ncbi:hypothetical protein TNCV_3841561 [Trichonephila clavipes]|nr:hypothetical protein TNCV_3841561 [Trichonephila clavipes]
MFELSTDLTCSSTRRTFSSTKLELQIAVKKSITLSTSYDGRYGCHSKRPRSSDEGNTRVGTSFKLPHHINGKTLNGNRFIKHQPLYTECLQCH